MTLHTVVMTYDTYLLPWAEEWALLPPWNYPSVILYSKKLYTINTWQLSLQQFNIIPQYIISQVIYELCFSFSRILS